MTMTGEDKGAASRSAALVAPELLPALDMIPALDLSDAGLALIRAGMARGTAAAPLSAGQATIVREERFVPGPAGEPDVRLLVYTPPGDAAARPAYLHMHGGGFVLGSADIGDAGNRALALAHDCVVVSVDYRLAPETRFPGALQDCYAALAWLHGEAATLGVDRSRIAVGGESAGGGHAAALALLARDRGEFPLCFQLLDAPMLDDRTGTGTGTDPNPFAGEYVWTPERNRFGWRALLGQEPGGGDVPAAAAPARAASLAGLPATMIAVGALDLFVDENIAYARRLIHAGVPTELHILPGAFHGFGVAGAAAPQVQALMRYRHDALARAFRPPGQGVATQS